MVTKLHGKQLPYVGMLGLGMFCYHCHQLHFFHLTMKESILDRVASACLNIRASV